MLRLQENHITGLCLPGGPVGLSSTTSAVAEASVASDSESPPEGSQQQSKNGSIPRTGSAPAGGNLDLSLLPSPTPQHFSHYRVTAPVTPTNDRPLHLVLVVDVSGSMGSSVEAISADGSRESNGFTLLDLVKHSLLTVLASLGGDYETINTAMAALNGSGAAASGGASAALTVGGPSEPAAEPEGENEPTGISGAGTGGNGGFGFSGRERYLSLVKFTTAATIVFEKLDLSKAEDRKTAFEKINSLTPECSTNLWGGLQKGLEVCKSSLESSNAPCELMLFTDGLPNVAPPRGSHVNAFQHFLKQNSGLTEKVTLRTYGFGYSLDAKLLDELARVGRGTFSFIPDSGFVGTIFIHSLASMLSVCDGAGELVLELGKGETLNPAQFQAKRPTDMITIPGLISGRDYELIRPKTTGERNLVRCVISLRGLEYGQPRDFVVQLNDGIVVNKAYVLQDSVNVGTDTTPNDITTGTITSGFVNVPNRVASLVSRISSQPVFSTNNKTKISSEQSSTLQASTLSQKLRQELVELLQTIVDEKQRAFGVEGQFSTSTNVSKDDLEGKNKRVSELVQKFKDYQENMGNNAMTNGVNANENVLLKADSLKTLEVEEGYDVIGQPARPAAPSEDSTADSEDAETIQEQADALFEALITDLEGQVTEATSKTDYYNRWGATYLRSLMGAHRFQRRNNFKDPGVQLYNNSEPNNLPCFFERQITSINHVFDSLTPPKPSASGYSYGAGAGSRNYTAAVSMSSYNNRYGPCFSGDSLIQMADGSAQRVDTIHKGSIVLSGVNHTPARVRCVIETRGDNMAVVRMRGNSFDAISTVNSGMEGREVAVKKGLSSSLGAAFGAEYSCHENIASSFSSTHVPASLEQSPACSDDDIDIDDMNDVVEPLVIGSPIDSQKSQASQISQNSMDSNGSTVNGNDNDDANAMDVVEVDGETGGTPPTSPSRLSLSPKHLSSSAPAALYHVPDGSFSITPWHPIYDPVSKHWVFPRDVAVAVIGRKGAAAGMTTGTDSLYGLPPSSQAFSVVNSLECADVVYNFLLDEQVEDKTILVGGTAGNNGMFYGNGNNYNNNNNNSKQTPSNWVTTCTLGHGMTSDAVINHSYFGDWKKVVSDLAVMEGWDNGLVKLEASKCCVKNEEGLVGKMVQ